MINQSILKLYIVNFYRYILIFCFISFVSHADQNDKRLDDYFIILKNSQNDIQLSNIISNIWAIWLETNDPLIERDFQEGLQMINNGQFEKSIMIFSKAVGV